MKAEDRKAAVAACKEQKADAGIFAVRCAAAGGVWVGPSPNLGAAENKLWFTLRTGSHPRADLQQAWRDHGRDSLRFEVLERLDPDLSPTARTDRLKKHAAHWRERLGAAPL